MQFLPPDSDYVQELEVRAERFDSDFKFQEHYVT
jgi:hypothetical protein